MTEGFREPVADPTEIAPVTCDSWGADKYYPLHEEWASGNIDGREYRVLRSLQGPHVFVEFGDMETAMVYELGDMVHHAHFATITQAEDDDQ